LDRSSIRRNEMRVTVALLAVAAALSLVLATPASGGRWAWQKGSVQWFALTYNYRGEVLDCERTGRSVIVC
jgi:hypothetical protein